MRASATAENLSCDDRRELTRLVIALYRLSGARGPSAVAYLGQLAANFAPTKQAPSDG